MQEEVDQLILSANFWKKWKMAILCSFLKRIEIFWYRIIEVSSCLLHASDRTLSRLGSRYSWFKIPATFNKIILISG